MSQILRSKALQPLVLALLFMYKLRVEGLNIKSRLGTIREQGLRKWSIPNAKLGRDVFLKYLLRVDKLTQLLDDIWIRHFRQGLLLCREGNVGCVIVSRGMERALHVCHRRYYDCLVAVLVIGELSGKGRHR